MWWQKRVGLEAQGRDPGAGGPRRTGAGPPDVGESCEIEGLGPVPVAVVESWKHDAYLRLIVTDGIDVKAITRRMLLHRRGPGRGAGGAIGTASSSAVTSTGAWSVTTGALRPVPHHLLLDGLGRMCWWHHLLQDLALGALVGGPVLPPDATGHDVAGTGDVDTVAVTDVRQVVESGSRGTTLT